MQRSSKLSIWLLLGCLAVLLLGFIVIERGHLGGSAPTNGGATNTGAWLSVRVFPDGQGWAVTVHALLHTTDDGQHWTKVTPWTSADLEFGGRLDELATFLDGQQAWLVLPGRTTYVKFGQNQQPELARSFRTIDGGRTWQKGTLPDTGSTYQDTQSGAGFVGGISNPLSARYEARGQVGIHSISAIDGQHAWVSVGKSFTRTGGGQEEVVPVYSRIWQSSDGGQSWQLVMDQEQANNSSGTLIGGWSTFFDNTTGLMAASTPDTVLVSHDGGAKWTPQHLPTPDLTPQQRQRATPGQAIFFDRQNGIIPVNIFRDDQHIGVFQYITHDGAKTWQISPTEDISTFGRACYLDAQNWVLMVNNTTLLRTADGGTSWRTIPMHTGFAYIGAISLAPNLEGWAIGRATQTLQGDQYNQDNSTTVLKTTDGGRTWVQPNYTVS